MKISRDLTSARLIHLKAALFLVVGLLSATLLVAETPTLKTVCLLCLTVWAFCRVYYYLFYVLDRYVGREQRFAGVIDAVRYLRRRRGKGRE